MFLKELVWIAVWNIFQVYVLCDDFSLKRSTDHVIPCAEGWYYFGNKCYKLEGRIQKEARGWNDANEHCKTFSSGLVSIHSQEENDFLTTYMILDIKWIAWIGLNDRTTESEYVWSDGTPSDYKNWKSVEPNSLYTDQEDCVEMLFQPPTDDIGTWNDVNCDNTQAYICQAPKSKTQTSNNPMFCSAEDGGGWKFQNSCYHIVTQLRSFDEAEEHCRRFFQGHLVTIVDKTVDIFLNFMLYDIKKDVWIGIKIQEKLQQWWNSGWFVSYDGGLNITHDSREEMCVLRKTKKQWTIVPCSKRHAFVCEKSKDRPPALKPPVKGSYCPKTPAGWRDLHGEFCYFTELEKTATWNEANFDCLYRGGNLLSLHSKEESDALFQFIKYKTNTAAFVGLHGLMNDSKKFVWSDGSMMNYENWNPNEPNGFHEKCGEVLPQTMKWNDVACDGKRYYFCSTRKIQPSAIAVAECNEHIFYKVMIGVSVMACVQTVILVGITIYYFRTPKVKRRKEPAEVLPPLPRFNFSPITGVRYSSRQQLAKYDDEDYCEVRR